MSKKRFQQRAPITLLKQNGQAMPAPVEPSEQLVEIPPVASEPGEIHLMQATVEEAELPPGGVHLHIPFDTDRKVGYCQRHFTFQVDGRQALALDILRQSLSERAERFHVGGALHSDGRVVEKGVDALRWLLDQMADAAGMPD